jgi:hypothetical protein
MKKTFLVAATLLGAASIAGAQTTIGAPGGASVCCFAGTPTYGQTFMVPTNGDSQLDAFSFWLGSASNLQFKAYVYAWDAAGMRASGPALFTSALMSAPNAGAGFHEVAVSTGGVSLTGGNLYVAFLSNVGVGGTSSNSWEYSTGDTYAAGQFVYHYTGSDWTGTAWTPNHQGVGRDLRFEMQFSATQMSQVPEPATVALSATGLLALGGIGAFRRRRAAMQA